jgi:thioredoxin 1
VDYSLIFEQQYMKQKYSHLFLFALLLLCGCGDESTKPAVTQNNNLEDIESKAQFDVDIETGTSLIFYHASWCTRCAAQRPAVETIAKESAFSSVYFGEVEYEDFSDIVTEREVTGFPTIVIYKDNKEIKRFAGQGHLEDEIRNSLTEALK